MSTIISRGAAQQNAAWQFLGRLASGVKQTWDDYRAWRIREATTVYLKSLSDRELKDIGLVRSQIDFAVRGALDMHPAVCRHF